MIFVTQMNVRKAVEKLQEWVSAGEALKKHLSEKDEVLVSWLNQLEEFSQDLPLLLQLSSDALKVFEICPLLITSSSCCGLCKN